MTPALSNSHANSSCVQVLIATPLCRCTTHTQLYHSCRISNEVNLHDKQHPREMAEKEISELLTYLAVKEHVAASTQDQALTATASRAATQ